MESELTWLHQSSYMKLFIVAFSLVFVCLFYCDRALIIQVYIIYIIDARVELTPKKLYANQEVLPNIRKAN